ALSLGRSVCPALAPAPPTAAARLEVSRAVRVVGIGGPTNFDMALDSGAGGPVEGEHLALALFLGEPDAEESLGRREVLALLPGGRFAGMASFGPFVIQILRSDSSGRERLGTSLCKSQNFAKRPASPKKTWRANSALRS